MYRRRTLAAMDLAKDDDRVMPTAAPDERAAIIAAMDWAQLRSAVAACTQCILHQGRKQAVLGVGDEKAQWLFVGEGPGAEEDARGEPFVGQAGKLLDNMLAAIGLKRGENVYIANVVKCRPPGNRTPLPKEAQACEPYLAAPDRTDPAATDCGAGQGGGPESARQRRHALPACARSGIHIPRHAADRDLPSGLSAAQPHRQGQGLGRPVFCGGNHADIERHRLRPH